MKRLSGVLAAVIAFAPVPALQAKPNVELVKSNDKVEVMIGGSLITQYLFGSELAKPVLVPVRTPSGIEVTRRYPLTELKGGSDGHRHHVGIFFCVDGVNGTEFWNNVSPPPQIKHIKITGMESGDTRGKLAVESQWIDDHGKVLLKEERTMLFLPGQDNSEYAIDFSIDLTAVAEKVVFEDTEEGVFAIRLADCLRERESDGVRPGRPLPKESIKGTGRYFSSNGDETADRIWGKRARWVAIQGVRAGKVVGVAILNHPESLNYPTYWHVRDYGLFSANPLGQGDFQRQSKYKNKNPIIPLRLTLKRGQRAHFRFLVVVFEGVRTQQQVEKRFRDFVK